MGSPEAAGAVGWIPGSTHHPSRSFTTLSQALGTGDRPMPIPQHKGYNAFRLGPASPLGPVLPHNSKVVSSFLWPLPTMKPYPKEWWLE